MNQKFFSLPPEKQRRIINAGLRVFATYDYKHASTDMIAREADISKSLLFHYFGSKKALYLYLYEYAMKLMIGRLQEVYEHVETDFFEFITAAQLQKMSMLYEYPDMTQFILKAYLESSNDVSVEIDTSFQGALADSMARLLERVDPSKFKESITVEQAFNVVVWLSEGYMKQLSSEDLEDIESVNRRFLDYMELLRRHFYREECL